MVCSKYPLLLAYTPQEPQYFELKGIMLFDMISYLFESYGACISATCSRTSSAYMKTVLLAVSCLYRHTHGECQGDRQSSTDEKLGP